MDTKSCIQENPTSPTDAADTQDVFANTPYIQIRVVENGYLLRLKDVGSEKFLAFQSDNGETQAFVEMLQEIDVNIGPITSRHSKFRPMIRVEHGDKYECKDPNCDICMFK